MNERRLRILHLVAERYIRSAHPVASAAVAKHLGLSSATVRNEFAALEGEGYLHQPHASAGRIPTSSGFRRYAERFLPPRPLPKRAQHALRARLGSAHGDALLPHLANAVADLSGYAVVVTLPADDHLHALEIHLSVLSDRSVLAVVVLETGLVRQVRITLDPAPSDRVLDDAERNLRQLTLPLRHVPAALRQLARGAEAERGRTLLALADAWPDVVPTRSATAGLRQLLDEPESRDPDFIRLVIEQIESPGQAADATWCLESGDGSEVEIDTGEAVTRMRSKVPLGEATGALTLLGPTRMRYGPALRAVRGVCDALRQPTGV
jgi:heat-inducible transcriptional repressor